MALPGIARLTLHTPPRRIGLTLAVLFVVLNGLAALGAFSSLHDSRRDAEEHAEKTTQNFAALLDENISREIDSIRLTLLALADDLTRQLALRPKLDTAAVRQLLERHHQRVPFVFALRLTDAQGQVLVGTDIAPSSRVNLADRDYFRTLSKDPDAGIVSGELIEGRITPGWLVPLATRYNHPDGSFAGVLTAPLPVEHFRKLLSTPDLDHKGVALLRDAQGALIARTPPIDASGPTGSRVFSPELHQVIASGHTTATFHSQRTADGIERTSTYRRLKPVNFHLVVGVASNDYLDDWNKQFRRDMLGLLLFFVGSLIGTSLLWQATRQNQQAMARSRILLRNASDGIHILDREGRVIEASDAFCRMLGYTHDEVIGMEVGAWDAFFAPDTLRAKLRELIESKEQAQFETRHRRKDGSCFDVEITSHALLLDGVIVLFNSARDISERKRAETELAESRERYRQFFEVNSSIKLIIDPADERIVDANRAAVEFYGYPRESLIGRPISDINCLPSEEWQREMALAQEEKRLYFNFKHRLASGEIRDVEVYSGPSTVNGRTLLYSIIHDVTQRRQMETELIIARQTAEQANLAKSRFLATMSHEIRTPMNGILGMAQMLLTPKLSEKERFDYARIIRNSGHTLLTLLNDILDLSKVEAGKLSLEALVFSPAQVIDEIAALFYDSAHRKALRLEAIWQGDPGAHYRGDPYRLRQMLSNLVGNAIKFTERGSIAITAREIVREGNEVRLEFTVSDTGIGIPAEKLEHLFQPFTQADDSTTRVYGGTGLGLSIVRSLAQLMGGHCGVESEQGKGSRFWFRVTLGRVAAGQDMRSMPRSEGERTAYTDDAMPAGRILVVEDNAINRKIAKVMLTKFGLSVLEAEDGAKAVAELCSGAQCDLVLMDIQMPVMDGYEATRRIRAWEAGQQRPRLPIIALTADAFVEDRQQASDAGMDDFLTKPIDVELLRAALRHWLAPAGMPAGTGQDSNELDEIALRR